MLLWAPVSMNLMTKTDCLYFDGKTRIWANEIGVADWTKKHKEAAWIFGNSISGTSVSVLSDDVGSGSAILRAKIVSLSASSCYENIDSISASSKSK